MGEPACDLLDAELAIDRVEAELAAELPAHVRAFAAAYARGEAIPAAPALLRSERAIAAARQACMHELLADRGLALLRLVAPVVIESDPEVARLRAAARTWPALAALSAARDAVSRARLGRGFLALAHALAGAGIDTAAGAHVDASGAFAVADAAHVVAGGGHGIAALPRWFARDRDVSDAELEAAWRQVAARFGVAGQVRLERTAAPGVSDEAAARTFVVVPGREVIVVVPPVLDTPAARFAALHELGHAVAALASPVALPRALDEAVASLVARLAETGELGEPWTSPLAVEARARRLAIARTLADVETLVGMRRDSSDDASERALASLVAARGLPAHPPAALWHDPGAQAAYVAAEAIADELASVLADRRTTLGEALANHVQRIDAAFPRAESR